VFVVPAAAQAAGGVENWFAADCKVESCKHKLGETKEEEKENAEKEGYTQAGGHPNFGISDFKINTTGSFPNEAPSGVVTHIRTDVAPGAATNPEALNKCSFEEFGHEYEPAPGIHTGLYEEPKCPEGSKIGKNEAVVWLGPEPSPKGGDLPLTGNFYNLVQPKGLASDFGVALPLPKALTEALLKGPTPQLYAHTLIEGNVEWGAEEAGTGKADYHDYYEVAVSPSLPLISSRLIFEGQHVWAEEHNGEHWGERGFLTLPTSCTGTGPQTTTKLKLNFLGEEKPVEANYTTPIGTAGCGLVPFAPTFALEQETTAAEHPDGIGTEFTLPHNSVKQQEKGIFDSSDVKTATTTLPEGLTLNPAAAPGLEACTEAQFGIGTKKPIECPEGSKLGTVALEVPGLPAGSLTGNVYLGGTAPLTGPSYQLFVGAASKFYNVIVRVKGTTTPDLKTGRITTSFTENPEQPFSSLKIKFNGGPLSPLANGLKCEASTASTTFAPFSAGESKSPVSNFEITGCPETIPFSLTQSTQNDSSNAGGFTSYTFSLKRNDGQQYLGKIKTTLPAGLVGRVPAITLCPEPQASQASMTACPAASRIGTATVTAGAGLVPVTFSGPVYMTGPTNGQPFGLSIPVEAAAGPFNLGVVLTRSSISVDPTTARITVETPEVPTIVKGVPVRLRSLKVDVNKQGFLYNPTNCSAEQTETTLTSTFGTVQAGLNSPFQVENCAAEAFAPKFSASTSAKTSRLNGASLTTTLTSGAGQANIAAVKVTLPSQLPSRQSTLTKACVKTTFEANPESCPSGSVVGTASVSTPTLPTPMTGRAYFVAVGGAEFPDLDLVVEGSGVKIILVGTTRITKGITTTTFASTPDVPVNSVTVSLPMQANSALAPNGDLCLRPLVMPTEITGQNGKVVKSNTIISVSGCSVKVVGHKVIGNTAFLTVKTFGPGRISGSGGGLKTVSRSLSKASNATTLKVQLSSAGRGKRRPFKTKIRVGFVPKGKTAIRSNAFVTVTFR
jgi:hypothetical protein